MPEENGFASSYLDAIESSFTILVASGDGESFNEIERSLVPFGYRVLRETDGLLALEHCRAEPPDILVVEPKLKGLSGLELCRALKQDRKTRITPILMLMSFLDAEQKVYALQAGADDFLYRPIHQAELRARVRSLLRIKSHYTRIEKERDQLDLLAQRRTRELDEMTFGIVVALERANTLNDEDTGGHIKRVCMYSHILGETIGLADGMLNKVRRYSSLHDVGKVGLPDSILKKRGALTTAEREVMKSHTVLGAEILASAKVDPAAINIALNHHERFDGRGYPRGLRATEIPIEGRIVALADVFDALSTHRCYKAAFSFDRARRIIEWESGKHFDPGLVQAFVAQEEKFRRVYSSNSSCAPAPPGAQVSDLDDLEELDPW